jgi:hypothetical protein
MDRNGPDGGARIYHLDEYRSRTRDSIVIASDGSWHASRREELRAAARRHPSAASRGSWSRPQALKQEPSQAPA